MKQAAIIAMSLMVPLASASARVTAVPRSDSFERGGERPSGRAERPPVVIKMEHRSVPQPQVMRRSDEVVHDRRVIAIPRQDERGTPIDQNRFSGPPQHTTAVRDRAFVGDIRHQQRAEIVPGRTYWHNDRGVHYAHYYDQGIHWYGFYHGPRFYWTRYYRDHWWWFDVNFNRWVYWWDGFWWWPSPGGAMYVYVDNNYYPYERGGVTVQKPEVQAPPESAPSASEGRTFNSPDSKRMVQLVGENSDAFLYDTSGAHPSYLKYLGRDIVNVRYSGGKNGVALKILVDFKDGTFALFSSDGQPLDAAAASSVDEPPLPEAPPSLPPGATQPKP